MPWDEQTGSDMTKQDFLKKLCLCILSKKLMSGEYFELQKKQGHHHKLRALVRENVKNVETCENL